ncbi:MAG TPA: MFS transporter [Herpetosiphonaceae bacterium]
MRAATWRQGIPAFSILWLGQLVSLIGSGLTRFALGVWVYQQTGSVTSFTLISLCAILPGGAVLPLAGALIDRWDRQRIMIACNSIAAGVVLLLLGLVYAEQLALWHIYLGVTLLSSTNIFQWTAFIASVPVLVPKSQIGRASGMIQTAQALSEAVAPLMAGALIALLSLRGLLLLDLLSFAFAVGSLLLVQLPPPERTAEGARAAGSIWHEARYGWTYIRARPGLFALLMYVTAIMFAFGVFQVLLSPLVLSFTSERQLGLILSAGGGGALLSGIVLAMWGGPRRRITGVFAFGLLLGLSLILVSLRPWEPLIALAAFIGLAGFPLLSACNQAIWSQQVEPDLQGRVFSIRYLISSSTLPTTYLVVGPLADQVFEPLLMPNGALAGSVGAVIGVGEGRGVALMLLGASIVPLAATLIGYLYPQLRSIDTPAQGE